MANGTYEGNGTVFTGNQNPLQQFVRRGTSPQNTTAGLVVDSVYAIKGVVDSLNQSNSSYPDPGSMGVNTANAIKLLTKSTPTEWYSTLVDDEYYTTYNLSFQFNRATFINSVSFSLLEVPCVWTLYRKDIEGTILANGIVNSYLTNKWIHISKDLDSTYQFDESTPLLLVLEKIKTKTQYLFGVRDFLVKLKALNYSDVNLPAITTSGIITQNPLGFVEQYTIHTDSITALTTNDITDYWKCAPQPVGDAIVDFTVDIRSYFNYGSFTGYFTSNNIIRVSTAQKTLVINYINAIGGFNSSFVGITGAQNYTAPVVSGGAYITDIFDYSGYSLISLSTPASGVITGRTNTYNFAIINNTLGPTSFNRMYLDPLYTGNSLNLYYSDDKINWSPVQRDLMLKKGVYELPTVYGQYIKFEITNLTPEPYDLPLDSVERTFNVFPDSVDNYYSNIEASIANVNSQQYYGLTDSVITPTYNTQLSTATLFGNANGQLSSNSWGSNQQTATSFSNLNTASSVTDPTISYKSILGISKVGSEYVKPGSSEFITRRFYQSGPHFYKSITLNQTWHQAYFTGIKQLNLYSLNQSIQNDYEEINDYFLSNSNTIVDKTNTTATLVSGGGYTGLAGKVILSKNLQSISNYQGFRIASLTTDWQSFLTVQQTKLLEVHSLPSIVGAIGTLDPSNIDYGILTVSGSTGTSFVTSALGGGLNLMTTAMSNFDAVNGWTPYPNTSTCSGTSAVALPFSSTIRWQTAIGTHPYGLDAYGASPAVSTSTGSYSFLVTTSGLTGSVTVDLLFTGPTTSGTLSRTFTVAGSGTNIVASGLIQPPNTNAVRFNLTPDGTGTPTFSKAGFFSGLTTAWVSPLITTNMRISATVRVYLPFTNKGSYRCSIYSGDTELAYKQVTKLPLRTWVDIEVPFTLSSTNVSNTFTAKLTQINGNREIYKIALIGLFYNPVSYEYSSDNGANWTAISTGINNPQALISTRSSTNQLMFKMTILKDGSYFSGISIIPEYKQNTYSSKTLIDYLSDIKTNELSWRRPPSQKPLFQLRQQLHPYEYDISVLMNIPNPYKLS